ncbi:MAG: LysR substrate-binding domain-containing protein [Phenylobacterium sp.]|nr:LysR substrate-binding domain-containing protein [Phenylobacterium sp.]
MAAHWFPPLTALRTFEAVARRGVGGAAAELNVTPAAISHQIRVLERELGVTLFTRSKQGLSLNLHGSRYLADVATGFDTIMAGTRRLLNPERTDRLVIDSLTSFANDVIIPRLGRLYRRYPKFELEVTTLSRAFLPLDFGRMPAHAAIRGGAVEGQWPDCIAEKLAHEVFFPVCAPSLMHGRQAVKDPADLAGHPLIGVSSTPEGWPEWLAAAKAKGMDVEGVDADLAIRLDTIHSATLAAMEGIGVGLGRGPLVDGAIEAGRLVEPFDLRVISTHAYWLVYPESSRELPAFQVFREWLLDELPALPER